MCLVGAGDESRAFGSAPRWTIINCPFCRQIFLLLLPFGQNARSRSRLHPRLSSVVALFPKRKTPRRAFFFLEQVKGGVVCTLPRVSKPIFLPIFRGFRGVFGYFSMLCPTAYSTAISYSLPLFCPSNLDFQLAKFERLSVVFVRVGDIVSHFYHGSRYGFKPVK